MAEVKKCPKCGREMVLRKNKKTGEEFWGCKGYSDKDNPCKYTEAKDQKFVECPKCKKQTGKIIKYKDKRDGSDKTALICDECGFKNWNYKE